MSTATPATRTPQKVRYIAPDLARGLALLGIALANLPTAWAVPEQADLAPGFGGIYGEATALESLAVMFHAMFVHVRGLPLFSTLLGFGVGLITMSLWRRGFPPGAARRVLWRRYTLLAVIGVAHLVLLFFGDIIVQYSVAALVLIALLTVRDRTLMIIAWVLIGLHIAMTAVAAVALAFYPAAVTVDSIPGLGGADSYLSYVGFNSVGLLSTLAGLPMVLFILGPILIIGFVWARRGVLVDAAAHARYLRTWVGVGVAVVVLVGVPWGLASLGVLPETWVLPLSVLNSSVGLLTGPGALALVALLFRGTADTLNPGLRAFVALGRRSMSGYILQSLLFVLLTQPFTLGLGIEAGILTQMGIAAGIWLVTLVWALAWDLLGWPGPVEWVHRRLSYGPGGLPPAYRPPALTSAQAGTGNAPFSG